MLRGQLMARHGLLTGSLLTALPFFLMHLPLAFESNGWSGTTWQGALITWGVLLCRRTVPALPDRHAARRHQRQHPGGRVDARLDQRRRRDGRRSRWLAARPALVLLTAGVAAYRRWRGRPATDGYAPAITRASEAAQLTALGVER